MICHSLVLIKSIIEARWQRPFIDTNYNNQVWGTCPLLIERKKLISILLLLAW